MKYFVYILECNDRSLYTGITTNLKRRVWEHNVSKKGAKYTKARRPVKLVYFCECSDRSSAAKKEYAIKQLPRKKKLKLLENANDTIQT